MIHSRATLSKVEKFHYLKAALEGPAAQVVGGYEISAENYDEAWNAVCNRFNNTRLIVSSHLSILFKQPVLTKATNVGLRRLADTTNECVRSLSVLGEKVNDWSTVLAYLVLERFDSDTKWAWELHYTKTEVPAFTEVMDFVERRIRSLDNAAPTSSTNQLSNRSGSHTSSSVKPAVRVHHSEIISCQMCNGSHALFSCSKFLALPVKDRSVKVKEFGLCFNCLRHGHSMKNCNSKGCKHCGKKHNSQLCFNENKNLNSSLATNVASTSTNVVNSLSGIVQCSTLLATALVKVKASNGTYHLLRALCDNGSQVSIISDECSQLLCLSKRALNVNIQGIGNQDKSKVRGVTSLIMQPRNSSDYTLKIDAVILNRITSYLPTCKVDLNNWSSVQNIELADPNFGVPAKIDLLLGADVWSEIVLDGIIRNNEGGSIAQNTRFGWVLSGPTKARKSELKDASVTLHVHLSLEQNIRKFWELEECDYKPTPTLEEEKCETIFTSTHYRNESGKYVINIPFDSNIDKLGLSRKTALKRFFKLEQRLNKTPDLKKQYVDCMREYESLGHMKVAQPLGTNSGYFIPHHAVIKESSKTTKLRVVYDASCKTSSGLSLNDCQLVGEKLQDSLFDILLRFRIHRVALTGDIEKMYRQIGVAEEQQNYQRILWRYTSNQSVQEYKLQTVTFGMASAPHCAIRTLQQCAKDESQINIRSSEVILSDFYVDDLITGVDNENDAIELYESISKMLKAGGFNMQKWMTNSPVVMSKMSNMNNNDEFNINNEEATGILGLKWFSSSDQMGFTVKSSEVEATTKREILSEVAKLYDPTGLLAPMIIKAKIIIQKLWLNQVDWDQTAPPEILKEWNKYHANLQFVENIRVPRWVGTFVGVRLQVHGFCDASIHAYGAAIFIRTTNQINEVQCFLLTAKTKVSPTRTISIPRLELCAAQLLAKLYNKVIAAMKLKPEKSVMWSDSTIVLSWINKVPATLKTFVGNRISNIQELTAPTNWRHVRSEDNPADCLSRGLDATELGQKTLWFQGPPWLIQPESNWPNQIMSHSKREISLIESESKTVVQSNVSTVEPENNFLLNRHSTLIRLKRRTATIFRFINNCLAKKRKYERTIGPITSIELNNALNYWIKYTQQRHFPEEIINCSKEQNLHKSSSLISLYPFRDNNGILRVKGRLQQSQMEYARKHPIILPRESTLAFLIIQESHFNTLHGGVQLMLHTIRQRYWILAARRAVTSFNRTCYQCVRQRKITANQQMGNLPSQRVNPSRIFQSCGVDFAGPVVIKAYSGRCKIFTKGYISLFICLATRAIHLELVSGLSTEAFIAAFRRFTARRGLCQELFSDHGTNFIGTKNELQRLRDVMQRDDVLSEFSNLNIKWYHIPPHAPHQGGIWEAGVKSVKWHLNRVISQQKLTFEEYATLLSQIESCLNSRPISPINDNVDDLDVLTPAHFIIGDASLILPDPNLLDKKMNRLTRWQLIQRLNQEFWKRWQLEYVSQLQQRSKWQQPQRNLQPGTLVLIKGDNVAPTYWLRGRIIRVLYGKDQLVRSAIVKTSTGELHRPIQKLCILPMVH